MILRKRDGRRRDDTTTNDGHRTPTTTTTTTMTQKSTLHRRGRRKMVAATGDGRWMITATTKMRGNARGGEEEVHAMKEDEGVGGARTTHDGR